jgi:hypothetical protein
LTTTNRREEEDFFDAVEAGGFGPSPRRKKDPTSGQIRAVERRIRNELDGEEEEIEAGEGVRQPVTENGRKLGNRDGPDGEKREKCDLPEHSAAGDPRRLRPPLGSEMNGLTPEEKKSGRQHPAAEPFDDGDVPELVRHTPGAKVKSPMMNSTKR